MLAIQPIDVQFQDTYYVVAHFHYVMVAGHAVRVLRRRLLLAAEVDRAPCTTRSSADWHFWAIVHLLQRRVLPDALPGPREEREVEADHREPEVPACPGPRCTCGRSISAARSTTPPKIAKSAPGHQHVVEMRNDVVRVLELDVDRQDRENEARETADREQEQEADREQHRRLEGDRAVPHRGEPVEHLHARREPRSASSRT